MKIRFIFLLLPAFIVMQGCVKILNDDLTAKETKLVINSAIDPDSVFEINLSRTFNIFDDESTNNLPFIDGADVKLYENGNFLFNLDNTGTGYYRKDDFFPVVGKTYEIIAEKEGFKSVSASTTVPEKVEIIQFDTVSVTNPGDYGSVELDGLITFQDPEESDDYYMLSAQILYPDANYYDSGWYNLGLFVPDGMEKLYENSYGNLLWSDRYLNGKEVTLQFGFFYRDQYAGGGYPYPVEQDSVHFRFCLQHVSREYFFYSVSFFKYHEAGGASDPFSEPVVIYSNVKNGYGVFGSYSQDTVNFKIVANSYGMKGGEK